MKVLLVSHDFLPKHAMGTEIYTAHLGRALSARGHDVHVFTTEKEIGLPNLSVRVREYEGLPVHELINNLFYTRFQDTWDYPAAARTFGLFLDDYQPDVVHFMHLMYLSVACVEEVARRGIPVFYTLHDYWLQCARFGQRKHKSGGICHEIDFDRCGTCMADFKFGQTRVERSTAKALARIRTMTGLNLAPAARGLAAMLSSSSSGENEALTSSMRYEAEADITTVELDAHASARAREIGERDRALRSRLLPNVDLFLAPSRFLRDRFLEWGIPPEQIRYLRTGIDLTPVRGVERRPQDGRLRIAFIGTVAPHKGTHILLEAWRRLPPELRAKGELTVYGPLDHYPAYRRRVQVLASECDVRLAGRLSRPDVIARLGELDCLVIPSIWYENSPLIILEALATRTPLLVSDLGGMAELVEEGISGYHFETGDADDLARQLGRFLEDRSLLDRLYPEDHEVQSIEFDAEAVEGLYREALRRREGGAGS